MIRISLRLNEETLRNSIRMAAVNATKRRAREVASAVLTADEQEQVEIEFVETPSGAITPRISGPPELTEKIKPKFGAE